jgi:hypothetical protein
MLSKLTPSSIRAFVRSLTVVATAFGLGFTAEQVASIQLLVEAILQMAFSKKAE